MTVQALLEDLMAGLEAKGITGPQRFLILCEFLARSKAIVEGRE